MMPATTAERDTRANASWPDYEQDLKANGVDYTMHMYPNANHGFHNDSTGWHDEEQANLSWERTVVFFKNICRNLRSGGPAGQ